MVQRPVADAPLLRTRVAAAEGAADAVEDADVCERVASIGIGDQSVRSLKYRRPERWLRMAVSTVLKVQSISGLGSGLGGPLKSSNLYIG